MEKSAFIKGTPLAICSRYDCITNINDMPRKRAYRAHLAYTAQAHMRQSFLFSRAYPLAAHEKRHRARRLFDMLFQSAIRAASCKAAERVLARQSTSGKRAYHAAARAVRLTAARHRILKFYDTSISFNVSLVNPPKSYILLYIILRRLYARVRVYARMRARLRACACIYL